MQDGNAPAVSAGREDFGLPRKGLNRVLEILEFLHTTQRAIGIGDLAKGERPRSTTYTLVRSLVDAGLLRWQATATANLFRQEALSLRNGLCGATTS